MSHDGLPNPTIGGRRSEAPLRGYGGSGRREQPILELGPLPRWSARAKVVPIVGGREPLFDVVVSWVGPSIPGFERPPIGVADAETSYVTDDQELAKAIAMAAIDLIRDGEVPFMDDVAACFRARGAAWRRLYEARVGDAGRAAAEGF